MSDYLDPNNEELLKDFFMEAQAMVDALEQNILVLENDPGNRDAVDEIFRAAHTLKGAAATVQITELSEFTHLAEDVLDEIRSGSVVVTGDVVDILLQSIDIVKAMLSSRMEGAAYTGNISGITANLNALLSGPKTPKKESSKKGAVAERRRNPRRPLKRPHI
jgi:two-component system chemotaxis sensor kinase CheA